MRISSAAQVRTIYPAQSVLGLHVATGSFRDFLRKSLVWAKQGQSRAVMFANVHLVMESYDDAGFCQRLNSADIVNPDGMPVVWALQALGERGAERVCGPDAMVAMLAAAEQDDVSVGFYGSSEDVLKALSAQVRIRHPRLRVVFVESPPFRHLSAEEDAAVVARLAESKVQLLFVGLGCPKQETWIMDHVGRVSAVMCGVGAAFDFFAGTKPQAPRWMMRTGLEWLFRFACEPRRLAGRYIKHNHRFVAYFLWQLLTGRVSGDGRG